MSANPQNPNPGLRIADAGAAERRKNTSSGREALQALIAFSSLHEQIRRRRAIEAENGRKLTAEDAWHLEQFVLDEVLHLVAERAQAITGADGVAIALADGEAVVCRASVGVIVPDPGVRLNPNSGFSGSCFRSGEIIRCDDTENDPRVNEEACRRMGSRSMVAVPLLGRTTVIGLLEAFSTEAYAFNDSDVRSLSLLSELILAAIKPEEEDRMAEISQQVSAESSNIDVVAEPGVRTGSPTVPPDVSLSSPTAEGSEAPVASTRTGPQVPDEIREAESLPEAVALPAFSVAESKSNPGWLVAIVLIVIAAAVGGGTWWIVKFRLRPSATSAGPAQVNSVQADQHSSVSTPTAPVPVQTSQATTPSGHDTGPTEVMGVRHWSSGNTTTVAIDLQDAVQYDAHRLTGPDRIYFDLFDTWLAPDWFGKTVDVSGSRLEKIRVAQSRKGVTRVVLETKGPSSFSVSLQQNPSRLIVEIGGEKTGISPQSSLNQSSPLAPSENSQNLASATKAKMVQMRAAVSPASIIVLDPGHGGWDLGSVGQGGLLEKDLVLDIVKRLGKLIASRLNATVIYTRHDDTYVSLERRAEIANLDHANLFVSVHANYSSSPSAHGVETYYSDSYSSVHARTPDADATYPELKGVNWTNVDIREKALGSERLARNVQDALFDTLAARNPDLPDRGVKEASYAVLVGTTMPAVLAEVSFVSSPQDEKNLQSEAYRQKIAAALYSGIANYVKHARDEKLTSLSRLASAH